MVLIFFQLKSRADGFMGNFCQTFREELASVVLAQLLRSDSLRPHGLQHARLPCTSPTPGACSNSCPLSL